MWNLKRFLLNITTRLEVGKQYIQAKKSLFSIQSKQYTTVGNLILKH